MEKETRITALEGCEIEKVELIDGVAVVTFRDKERKLPKSYEELCELSPSTNGEYYINGYSKILQHNSTDSRDNTDKNLLPDRATAEAVLALCQLIQLRECYNGDWVPDYLDNDETKYFIEFFENRARPTEYCRGAYSPLFFKTEDLRDEFFKYFRQLIEKLKPLYSIKEGGDE